MFREIPDVLNRAEIDQLTALAARSQFVDGRISAQGSPVKNNVQVGEQNARNQSAQILANALYRSEDFRVFSFPKAMIPPVLTRYDQGMHYGTHVDAAYMQVSDRPLRSDLSVTIFISDASAYEGGALRINLGSTDVRIKGKAGSAIVYPSTFLHEVEPVTSGSRLIGLTFVESRIANSEQREWLFELNEVAAIAGEKMDRDTFTRLQRVRENLLRYWSDAG